MANVISTLVSEIKNTFTAAPEPMEVLRKNGKPKGVGHFHHLLPYRFYDDATGLFHNYHSKQVMMRTVNRNGLGFGFRFEPLSGTNIDMVKIINDIICTKLPTGKSYSYQFCLTADRKLLHQLKNNQKIHSARGGRYADLARIQSEHAIKAVFDGFPSGYGKHARFDLKNYTAWFFVNATISDQDKIKQVKEDIDIALSLAQIHAKTINAKDLIDYVTEIMVNDPASLVAKNASHNPYDYLNKQVFNVANMVVDKIESEYIDVKFNDKPNHQKNTRIVCLSLHRLPAQFFAGQLPDCLASAKTLGLATSCPFLWSVNFQNEDNLKAITQAKKKIKSIYKLKQMQLERILPFLNEELTDYLEIEKGLEDDRYRLCNFSMDIILFSTAETWKKDREAAISLFKKESLELSDCQYLQGQILHAIFPFCYGDLSEDHQNSGTRHRVKSTNVANFIPMVADYKGALDTNKQSQFYGHRYGLITPTVHNQLAFLSPFFMGQDSYNIVIAGAMGAGKSVLAQMIINQIVSMGGYCWAIDKGSSYADLCTTTGGKQISATSLYLNPFSFLDIEAMRQDPDLMNDPKIDVNSIFANSISAITELYYMMGKPDAQSIDPFEYNFLRECILAAYDKQKTTTLVDHVLEEIQAEVDVDDTKGDRDRRKSDWLKLLSSFKTTGINGRVFNNKSQLDPDVPFICIEMEGVPNDLKKPVMLALTIDIDNRIILSSKDQPKALVCEEVSQTLDFESKALEKKFSEGAATYRKKNATLITITQLIEEYFKNNLLSVIYKKAALKLVMLQNNDFPSFATQKKLFNEQEIAAIQGFRPSKEAHFSSFLLQKMDGSSSEHRYFLDPYSKILTTTKAEETAKILAYRKQGFSLDEALQKTVVDFYGDELRALETFTKKFNQGASNA